MISRIDKMKRKWRTGVVWNGVLALGTALWMSSCANTGSAPQADEGAESEVNDGSGVDVGFLLSMTYEEARQLGRQHLDMSPYCVVVADEIVVLRQTSEGVPLKARAKGRVFLQMEAKETMVALGQEAYVDRGYEVIVRGRPLLRRGNSMVEGLNNDTVYYINGNRLQVMGKHRMLTRQPDPTPAMIAANTRTAGSPQPVAVWNVMPDWKKSWQQGPNPLLPALSPNDIPEDMRAAPLHREYDDTELQPRKPGEKARTSEDEAEGRRSLGRRWGEEDSGSRLRLR